MSSFREVKRQARRDLHKVLSEVVLYLPERHAEPIPLSVRIHDAFTELGSLGGDSAGFAERTEITPYIRFVGFTPEKNAVIVTRDLGVYAIETVKPPHDISIDASVNKLTAGQVLVEGLEPDLPWAGLAEPSASP